MKRVLTRIALFSLLFFLLIPCPGFAGTKTFIKEYTYQASEDDSRNSSRVVALREVKRLLLEELGTYLESVTEVKNFQLTRDQITTLTAGIVQTEIIEEKWDGRVYWLKSKIVADEDKVVQSIDSLRKDREKTKELESMRLKSDELLRDNERLRKELASTKGGNREVQKTAYDRSIKELSSMEWLEKGYAAKDRRDFKKAIEAYSRAIELNPKNAMAYYARALVSNDSKRAIQDYYKLLEIEPKDSGGHLLRAWTYKELEKDDLALREFGKAIERASGIKEKAEAYNDRGRYYSAIKEDENLAVQDFSKAIELDPKDGSLYINRGHSYWVLRENDLALLDFNKAIELDPKNASAYGARAWFFKNDKPELAIADFSKAIELDRDESPSFYFRRAQVYGALQNYDLAIRDYSKMLELAPDRIFVYNTRASLYAMVGRHDLAVEDYSKTIELKPNRSAYMDRGKYIAKYDEHTQAIKDFTTVIKMKPDYEALVARGFSHFKLGKDDLALKDYNTAITLNYSSPERVYYNRAVLYARKKDTRKAIQDLAKATKDPYYKREAQKDQQFDSLRNDPNFIMLVGP